MKRGARYEARKHGHKRYFTGKPCRNGHICERITSNTRCVECNTIIAKQFLAEHLEKHRQYQKNWRTNDLENAKQLGKQSHIRHREKRNAYSRLYNKRNRKRLNAYNLEWKKRDTNASKFHNIGHLLRCRLRLAIKGKQKSGSAVRDLGCSIEWFMAYIAAKFEDGMNWENHGKVWQLDHIKPVKDFDLTKREQFLEACHFTNLQPLAIASHREKSAMEAKLKERK